MSLIAPEVDDLEQIDLNEIIECYTCDAQATHRVTMRCCGRSYMFCQPHLDAAKLDTADPGRRGTGFCLGCRRVYRGITGIYDIARVVQL